MTEPDPHATPRLGVPTVPFGVPVAPSVPSAPAVLSPDGRWWWDGTRWVPTVGAPGPALPYATSPGARPEDTVPGTPAARRRRAGALVGVLVGVAVLVVGLVVLYQVVSSAVEDTARELAADSPLGALEDLGGLDPQATPGDDALEGLEGLEGLPGLEGLDGLDDLATGGDLGSATARLTLSVATLSQEAYRSTTGTYSSDLDALGLADLASAGVTLQVLSATADTFCMSATGTVPDGEPAPAPVYATPSGVTDTPCG